MDVEWDQKQRFPPENFFMHIHNLYLLRRYQHCMCLSSLGVRDESSLAGAGEKALVRNKTEKRKGKTGLQMDPQLEASRCKTENAIPVLAK